MIRYKMFEKEITKGAHTSFHFCVDKFGNNFHPRSKQYPIDQALSKFDKDWSNYDMAITTSTTTSEGDYFHISSLKNNVIKCIERDVLDMFNIPNLDFNCIYITKAFPYVDTFKCGFDFQTFSKFNSNLFGEATKVFSLFREMYNGVMFAGDFTKDGEFIDDSINIEVIPHQRSFARIKLILLDNFDIDRDKIGYYDRKFMKYEIEDHAWHIKIKLYKDRDPTVKFYRTYPNNPYLDYTNYQ